MAKAHPVYAIHNSYKWNLYPSIEICHGKKKIRKSLSQSYNFAAAYFGVAKSRSICVDLVGSHTNSTTFVYGHHEVIIIIIAVTKSFVIFIRLQLTFTQNTHKHIQMNKQISIDNWHTVGNDATPASIDLNINHSQNLLLL